MSEDLERLSTGINGLDEVLNGGFLAKRTYLIRGGPGSGKTTLGLHFLTAGLARGEKVMVISLGETEVDLRKNAGAVGIDLQGVHFLDLCPGTDFFTKVESYDIFSPAEVEREPLTLKIIDRVEELRPKRVLIDAMTHFRYLASDAFQFRRQTLSFLRFLVERETTVLMTSEGSLEAPDDDLQFLSDGVITLDSSPHGTFLAVTKYRGSDFNRGSHTMVITQHGMRVFPRLVPGEHDKEFRPVPMPSGIPDLDRLLHGGIERGTTTLITGPSGVGKSTLGLQFMKEAAGRGERSVVYVFEESLETLTTRCESINIPVQSMMQQQTLSAKRVVPLELTSDEFAAMVREEIEERQTRIVMIDSVAGYKLAMRGEDPVGRLYALTKFLVNKGVTVLLVNEVEGNITGEFRVSDIGISWLCDNIIFLRYIEMLGGIHKTIGVLKKRLSDFEKTLREFEITRYGIRVGEPLKNLRGILTGTPELMKPTP